MLLKHLHPLAVPIELARKRLARNRRDHGNRTPRRCIASINELAERALDRTEQVYVGGTHEEKPVNIDRSDHRPGASAASAVAGLPANYGGRVSDCHPHRPAVDGRICKSPARPGLFLRSPGLPTVPIVDFLAGLIFRVTVSLLESAFELVLLACDDIEIIVGQLAPLLLDLSLHFLPVAFNPIPVHR
jgi:hypothetical protein